MNGPATIDDPELGVLAYDDGLEAHVLAAAPRVALEGAVCAVFIQGLDDPDAAPSLRAAVGAMCAASTSWLSPATRYVQAYRADTRARHRADGASSRDPLQDVWAEVQIGAEMVVSRRAHGDDDDGVYASLECCCDWEPEHGLQLVFRDGVVVKVGPFDGHLTHADAFGDRAFAGVVYRADR